MNTPRVLYFGISTEKSADEVGGWSKVEKMGLREAIIYDTSTRKKHSYNKSNVTDLIKSLQSADLVVGFNQTKFDYRVLSKYTSTNFETLPNFDILDKIEEALSFRVSRENLAQNTLGSSNINKTYCKIEERVDITKKLFSHGCREGYLLFDNKRSNGKDRCDTSNWAETARNLSQGKKFIAETKESIKNNISEHPENSIPNTPTPPMKPWIDKFETNEDCSSQVEPGNQSTIREDKPVSEKWQIETPSNELHNSTQFVEIAQNIYKQTTNRPARELYAYNEMAQLHGSAFTRHQFMAAIGRVCTNTRRNRKLEKKGYRYHYIDGSGTVASELVKDATDIRLMKEELARGI